MKYFLYFCSRKVLIYYFNYKNKRGMELSND